MSIKSLSWTTAFTLLAITGSAMAQEPGAVTNYKSKVTNEINTWARNLDQDDTSLQRVAGEWHVVKDSMDKAVKARETLENERFKLEAAKKDLEKKRDDLQKEADKQVDAVKKGATIVAVNKTKEEITKKTAEITAKTADIQKAAGEEKKIDAELTKKKADVVNAVKSAEMHNNAASAIGLIPSPSKEDEKKVLEKDTKGAYRTEWGPVLATWMEGQLNAKKQKWKEIGANVKVNWTQSALEKKMGPVVTVTLKLPDVNAKPARGALNMR